jgi:putative heme utilization carrier protein HutX
MDSAVTWGRRLAGPLVAACSLVATAALAEAPAGPVCLSPEQRAAAQAKIGPGGEADWMRLPKELGIPEAALVQALPASQVASVGGDRFMDTWALLQKWSNPIMFVFKGGHVFEIHGPIPRGEPSKVSKYFNLQQEGAGVSGHLRPDLITQIIAVNRKVRGRVQAAVMFFDATGEQAFAVFIPEGPENGVPKEMPEFEATRAAMSAWPDPCHTGEK